MFSSALRMSVLQGRATLQTPLMRQSMLMAAPSQAALLGMAPSAGFAKYQRNKPHLNVGTIGKSLFHLVSRPPRTRSKILLRCKRALAERLLGQWGRVPDLV